MTNELILLPRQGQGVDVRSLPIENSFGGGGTVHLRPEGGQLLFGGCEQPPLRIENLQAARRILDRGPVLKRSSGGRRRVSNRDHQRIVDRQQRNRRLRQRIGLNIDPAHALYDFIQPRL